MYEFHFLSTGFNSTETKIQTPDGKVWKQQDFHNLREIYRDISRQFPGKSMHKIPQCFSYTMFVL